LSESQNASRPSHRIPDFATREEEAEWWDTHSITDCLDELEPVQVRFSKSRSNPIAVRLDPQDRVEADRNGIGPSTLIRMWVRERLKQGA
jgi:predicted glycoside hydrolase/deacetylase ChbG (UPF0249 family)